MATIHSLVSGSELIRLDPHLAPNELQLRLIHISPNLRSWLEEELPKLTPQWTTQVRPDAQLAQLIDDFCGGTALFYPTVFHPMKPVGKDVWVLKTKDVRIFGWFHARDCFIGAEAADATTVKQTSYTPYINRVVAFRNNLNLDHPKQIVGDNPDDVLSNCHPS